MQQSNNNCINNSDNNYSNGKSSSNNNNSGSNSGDNNINSSNKIDSNDDSNRSKINCKRSMKMQRLYNSALFKAPSTLNHPRNGRAEAEREHWTS